MRKLKISSIVFVLLMLSLVPIYSLGWGKVNFLRNICAIICGIYIIFHYKYVDLKNTLPLIVYLLVIAFSSWENRESMNLEAVMRHIALMFEIVVLPEIITKRRSVADMTKIGLYLLIPYWVISVIVSMYIGIVPYGSGDVYFVGNKFNVAYLCILVIFMYGVSNAPNIRFKKTKYILYFLWLVSILTCIRISVFTGVIMLLIGIIMYINRFVKLNKKKRKRLNIVKSPIILLLAVILSGVIIIVIAAIFSLPVIADILAAINKTGTIESRLTIYSYLGKIIQNKPLLGHGFNTDIVKVTYAENAQNGLMKIIIENGFIGLVAFFALIWSKIKYSNHGKSFACDWIRIWIISYIFSAIIEITYSYHFVFILEIFYLQCMEELKVKNEKSSNYNNCQPKLRK